MKVVFYEENVTDRNMEILLVTFEEYQNHVSKKARVYNKRECSDINVVLFFSTAFLELLSHTSM